MFSSFEAENLNFLEYFVIDKQVSWPVKLVERVKIAHSFLQSVSDQFHIKILSLPM